MPSSQAELFWMELELQTEIQVVVWGAQKHLWWGEYRRSFLKWGSSTFLMGSAFLNLGMREKGCISRERGSSVLMWDESCAVDSLQGGR